jgi:hypothetical protein
VAEAIVEIRMPQYERRGITPPADRSSPDLANGVADVWSGLAALLSRATESIVVWKAAQGIDNGGDLDVAASEAAWPAAQRVFNAWAVERRLAATIVCDHAVGVRILVGCGGSAGARLLQLDLVDKQVVHGVPVWTASQLLTCATLVADIRRLRPGAEGVARVLADPQDETGPELVRADPAGAESLARVLGLRGSLATRHGALARSTLALMLVTRAFGSPRLVSGARATNAARRACPVIRALRAGRALPEPLPRWLSTTSRDHEVTAVA